MVDAPQTAYQGSKQMRRLKEDSAADRRADRGQRAAFREGSKRDKAHDAARKTIAGKGVKVRRVKAQTPIGGDDLGGMS